MEKRSRRVCLVTVPLFAALLYPSSRSGSLSREYYLSPDYPATSSVDQVIGRVTPGSDEFVTEKYAAQLSERLNELSTALKKNPKNASEVARLLAAEFRSSRLIPVLEVPTETKTELDIFQGEFETNLEVNAETFPAQFVALVADYKEINVADFEIVAMAAEGNDEARTTVDYELVGNGKDRGRLAKKGRWQLEWKNTPGSGWQLRKWVAVNQLRSQASEPVFADVSDAAFSPSTSVAAQLAPGVDYWRSVLDSAVGIDVFGNNGVAAGDIDGDGLDDFYICQPSGLPNRLYRNEGDGTFRDVTESAGVGVLDASSMGLFADIDNDADQDLVVITWKQPLLFNNDGAGRFALKPGAFRFAQPSRGAFTAASLADFDRDGYLDLYVCAYMYFLGDGAYRLAVPYHDANNGPPNFLFRNNGNGAFSDVTDATGMNENNHRWSFACAWSDYDQDGWPDLYVANDFGRNNLYRNNGLVNGRVTFSDVAARAGVEDIGAGMSVSWFDYNNDGFLDLYVGNMWSAAGLRLTAQKPFHQGASAEALDLYRRHAKGNSLFANRGDGTFEDVSFQAKAEMGRWAWSCNPLDFDNDGWLDLYITNGLITNSNPHDL